MMIREAPLNPIARVPRFPSRHGTSLRVNKEKAKMVYYTGQWFSKETLKSVASEQGIIS